MTTFSDIPDEVLVGIFRHLRRADIMMVTTVCKRWNMLSLDNSVWKELYQFRFSHALDDADGRFLTGHCAWRDKYKSSAKGEVQNAVNVSYLHILETQNKLKHFQQSLASNEKHLEETNHQISMLVSEVASARSSQMNARLRENSMWLPYPVSNFFHQNSSFSAPTAFSGFSDSDYRDPIQVSSGRFSRLPLRGTGEDLSSLIRTQSAELELLRGHLVKLTRMLEQLRKQTTMLEATLAQQQLNHRHLTNKLKRFIDSSSSNNVVHGVM